MAILRSIVVRGGQVLMAALCLALPPLAAHAEISLHLQENKIKAGLLYNFLKYTAWPEDVAPQTFEVCLYGGDAFGGALNPLQGRTAQQRPINIREIYKIGDLPGCDIVFINRDQEDNLPGVLAALRVQKTMTMSDISGFAGQGGMVEFSSPEDKRVHLYINYNAVNQSGLRVGSELSKLAEAVK